MAKYLAKNLTFDQKSTMSIKRFCLLTGTSLIASLVFATDVTATSLEQKEESEIYLDNNQSKVNLSLEDNFSEILNKKSKKYPKKLMNQLTFDSEIAIVPLENKQEYPDINLLSEPIEIVNINTHKKINLNLI